MKYLSLVCPRELWVMSSGPGCHPQPMSRVWLCCFLCRTASHPVIRTFSTPPARQCQRSCWPRSAGLLVHCCNKQLGGEINDVIISSNEAWGLSLDFLYPYGGHNGEGRGCDFRSQGRGLSTLNCTAWGWSGFGFGSKLCDFEWVSSPLWAYSLSLYRQVETYSECSSPPEDDSQSSGLKDFTYNSKVLH